MILLMLVISSSFLVNVAVMGQVAAQGGARTYQDIKKQYNLADDVHEDYPVIFNIILFISISLILALIAICVAIATMDPGRDSLIYRVTSAQRYKKDN